MWPVFATLRQAFARGRTASPDASGQELAHLGLEPTELRALLRTDSLEPHFGYTRYRKPKASGGWREIAEPDPRLKRAQRLIVRHYLESEAIHPTAVAYQSGKSTRDHVRPHAGAAVVVTADVRDFFPSTRAERIEQWWRGRVSEEAARLLTILTTDRGALPQGAPTSPALSNLVNVELDARLALHATAAGARYTRYCDDLAFSWPRGSGPPSDFERGVRGILHEIGYSLHRAKGWNVHEPADEPEVTGVVLTRGGGVRLPDRIRDAMRRLAGSSDPHDAVRLAGYHGYASMVLGKKRRPRAKARGGPVPRDKAPDAPLLHAAVRGAPLPDTDADPVPF